VHVNIIGTKTAGPRAEMGEHDFIKGTLFDDESYGIEPNLLIAKAAGLEAFIFLW
jgi:hypothetical protein